MRISKTFEFHSAHYLENPNMTKSKNFEVFGACSGFRCEDDPDPKRKFHGHCYRMQVTVEGTVDPDSGFLINFKDLKRVTNAYVIDIFDHNTLNDVMSEEWWPVTVENMLAWVVKETRLLEMIKIATQLRGRVTSIKIWETDDSLAEWREGDEI